MFWRRDVMMEEETWDEDERNGLYIDVYYII